MKRLIPDSEPKTKALMLMFAVLLLLYVAAEVTLPAQLNNPSGFAIKPDYVHLVDPTRDHATHVESVAGIGNLQENIALFATYKGETITNHISAEHKVEMDAFLLSFEQYTELSFKEISNAHKIITNEVIDKLHLDSYTSNGYKLMPATSQAITEIFHSALGRDSTVFKEELLPQLAAVIQDFTYGLADHTLSLDGSEIKQRSKEFRLYQKRFGEVLQGKLDEIKQLYSKTSQKLMHTQHPVNEEFKSVNFNSNAPEVKAEIPKLRRGSWLYFNREPVTKIELDSYKRAAKSLQKELPHHLLSSESISSPDYQTLLENLQSRMKDRILSAESNLRNHAMGKKVQLENLANTFSGEKAALPVKIENAEKDFIAQVKVGEETNLASQTHLKAGFIHTESAANLHSDIQSLTLPAKVEATMNSASRLSKESTMISHSGMFGIGAALVAGLLVAPLLSRKASQGVLNSSVATNVPAMTEQKKGL